MEMSATQFDALGMKADEEADLSRTGKTTNLQQAIWRIGRSMDPSS
jgi:hypothetical protein